MVATRYWKILYDGALQSEPEGFLDAHRIAVEAILQRLSILVFDIVPITLANSREQRSLHVALSDLRVLRTAFKALQAAHPVSS